MKETEISLDDANNLSKYNSVKKELDASYDHIAELIRIRRKWDWYEHCEKWTIFWKSLEQQWCNRNNQNKKGLLVTIDIEKAFDSLDDNFLIFTIFKILSYGLRSY